MARNLIAGPTAVTGANADGAEIDAHAWLFTVAEDGVEQAVVVQVTGPGGC